MRYHVVKVDIQTEHETDYGLYNDYNDVLLIVKGYVKDDILPIYSRKGSRYFFEVTEVN